MSEDFSKIFFGEKVKGDEDTSLPELPSKRERREEDPAFAEYRRRGQEFLDTRKAILRSYARDISLSFHLSDACYINLDTGEINLDTRWFAEKGCTETQILWACLHEVEHFLDLKRDPEGMERNREHIIANAKKTGAVMMKKWEEQFGATHPEVIESLKKQQPVSKTRPDSTLNAVEQAAFTIWHTFYNIFDDVFVNTEVPNRAPAFDSTAPNGAEIESLYREKLFAGTDYTKAPRHLQFVYALLRRTMAEESLTLGKDAEDMLDQEIWYAGTKHSPRSLVDTHIRSHSSVPQSATVRYRLLQSHIEPLFERLLEKDIAEWNPKLPDKNDSGTGGGGEGAAQANPFQREYDKFQKNSPDQIGDDDIQKWFSHHQEEEEKKERERNKQEQVPEIKAAETAQDADAAFCEKHGIPPQEMSAFRQLENEVAPYLSELAQLWESIIYGQSRAVSRGMVGHFPTGTELDIQKAIEEFPQLKEARFDETKLMKRQLAKETLVKKPELIRVRLVADMSTSMNAAKLRVLRQCVTLFLSSLREFQTQLNFSRSQTKSNLRVDTQVWRFGDDAREVKRFRSDLDEDDDADHAEMIRALGQLAQTSGSTHDEKALKGIAASLSSDDIERIKAGKTMEIVLEITDGGSSAKAAAKNALDALLNAHIIARAFQIGKTSADEQQIFNEVWNARRSEPHGEIIGEEIANLAPALASALNKYLKGVRL